MLARSEVHGGATLGWADAGGAVRDAAARLRPWRPADHGDPCIFGRRVADGNLRRRTDSDGLDARSR